MLAKILDYINGALGTPKSQGDYEAIPEDEQVFPEDGIICVPEIGNMEGAVYELPISVGESIQAGRTLIAGDFDKCTLDIPSPCTGVISEIFVQINDFIEADTPIVKITRS